MGQQKGGRLIAVVAISVLLLACDDQGSSINDNRDEAAGSYSVQVTTMEFKPVGGEQTIAVDDLPIKGAFYNRK